MSVRVFYIEIFNNQVKVEERVNGKYKILRREGEDSFKFSEDFWEWFKDKIEYEGEELKFEILSDREIDFDKNLNILETKYIEDKVQNSINQPEEKIKNSNSLYEFTKRRIESYRRDR